MENLIKQLTGKNEQEAIKVASLLIDNANTELFNILINKTEYLFDFVKNNVNKRIEKVINKNNYKNIIKFFDTYSPYYDDLFANILTKYANQDLTDDIFELLEKGTIAQKTYAAKYFAYIPDTISIDLLNKYVFSDDEYLSFNAAQALGQMQDDVSYNIALGLLVSEDDFDKLKAIKFFVAYGNRYPMEQIFNAQKHSRMPENIAGQIPYMISLLEYLNTSHKLNVLITIDNIISGLGEILPLCDIFQFELYELLENLIEQNKQDNNFSGKIAQILLAALSKFKEFNENQEYIFDEDNNTKNEIAEIYIPTTHKTILAIYTHNIVILYIISNTFFEKNFSTNTFEISKFISNQGS